MHRPATRRKLLLALLAACAAPRAWPGNGPGKIPQVGILGPPLSSENRVLESFREGMRALGYVEGRNYAIEYREVPGLTPAAERLAMARELVALGVEVIVVSVTRNAIAAKAATAQIPIVMVNVGAVDSGLAANLERPGDNLTGISLNASELARRNLEILLEAVPGAERIGILANPSNPLHPKMIVALRRAAKERGHKRHIAQITSAAEIERAYASMTREHVGAMLVLADALFTANRKQIIGLAQANQLPSMYQNPLFVADGGLMAYAPNALENYRIAASYVDRLLKGAKPGDLPTRQPARFDLVINLKTAKALGLTIPAPVLKLAERLIE